MRIWPWTTIGDLRRRVMNLEESLSDKERLFQIQQTGWRETEARLKASQNQVEYLVRTIRQMDDQIFAMSQKTDWGQMHPHFLTLSDGMTARKVVESDRIGDILRPQLEATYAPSQKLIR